MMWQPWVGSWFPGMTPARMVELSMHQYLAMNEFVEKSLKAANR